MDNHGLTLRQVFRGMLLGELDERDECLRLHLFRAAAALEMSIADTLQMLGGFAGEW